MEVTKSPKPSMERAARRPREQAGRNVSERRAGLEKVRCGSRPGKGMGKAAVAASRGTTPTRLRSHRGNGDGMSVHGDRTQHGKPQRWLSGQRDAREGQAGPCGVADRLVVPTKPGNAGGGKEPDFGSVREVVKSRESGLRVYHLQPTIRRPQNERQRR
jgi:hypothetical protein